MKKKKRVLMIGGCDITAIAFYLKTKNVDLYSAVKGEKLPLVYSTCTSTLFEQFTRNIFFKNPFIDSVMYPPQYIKNRHYDVVVLSILSEGIYGIYENNNSKERFPFGCHNISAVSIDGYDFYTRTEYSEYSLPGLCKEDFLTLKKEYTFLGRISVSQSVYNFRKIVSFFDNNTSICFLLGPTTLPQYGEKSIPMIGANIFYKALNEQLRNEFKNDTNVFFVSPDDYYKLVKKKQYFYYNYSSITHYSRYTYRKMAKKICKQWKIIKFSYRKAIKRNIHSIIRFLIKQKS